MKQTFVAERPAIRHSRLLALAAALTLACGPVSDAATMDTNSVADTARAATGVAEGDVAGARARGSPGAIEGSAPARAPAAVPLARDRDQAFLRGMLDHHETVVAIAHDQMMAPAGHDAHGGASDPGNLDSALDAEKFEMLALLASLYGEQYSPRAAHPDTTASAATPAPGNVAFDPYRAQLIAQLRAGIALVDRLRPGLRRPQVRELAGRLRGTLVAQLRLPGEAPIQRSPSGC